MKSLARRLPFHYGWIAAGVVFLILLTGAGMRATPGVFIVPLETEFGWSRATVSLAIAINIILYGLTGPFAAALMQRIGIRKTAIYALALLSVATGLSSMMTHVWELMLLWGVVVGLGCGSIALTMGTLMVNRWFDKNRGLVTGLFSASMATGQLIFLPTLATAAEAGGFKPVVWIVSAAAACMIPVIFFLLPERPKDLGLLPYGRTVDDGVVQPQMNPITAAFGVLGRASGSKDFWLLFGTFFVCGASTNGLIGTHLIAACIDNGIPEIRAASLLVAIGLCDLVGTTFSGWLSDRVDNRILLFWYYGLRGLSLFLLPYTDFTLAGLTVFAVFYGLDWVATVPPTVRLTNDLFGKQDAPILFGWILAGHQLGGGAIAFLAGLMRTNFGTYGSSFILSAILCMVAAIASLWIGRSWRGRKLVPSAA